MNKRLPAYPHCRLPPRCSPPFAALQQSADGGSGASAANGETKAATAVDGVPAEGVPAAADERSTVKLDFDHFLALLREPSGDIDKQLYKFDDRWAYRAALGWAYSSTACISAICNSPGWPLQSAQHSSPPSCACGLHY